MAGRIDTRQHSVDLVDDLNTTLARLRALSGVFIDRCDLEANGLSGLSADDAQHLALMARDLAEDAQAASAELWRRLRTFERFGAGGSDG